MCSSDLGAVTWQIMLGTCTVSGSTLTCSRGGWDTGMPSAHYFDAPASYGYAWTMNGTPIIGVEGLQQAIVARSDRFLLCLAEKMFTYGLGRETTLADQMEIRSAVERMGHQGNTIRALIESIVVSKPFGNH